MEEIKVKEEIIVQVKKEEVVVRKYKTIDGKIFADKSDALQHEKDLNLKEKQQKLLSFGVAPLNDWDELVFREAFYCETEEDLKVALSTFPSYETNWLGWGNVKFEGKNWYVFEKGKLYNDDEETYEYKTLTEIKEEMENFLYQFEYEKERTDR
jgi:hypothetical protein